MVDWGRRGHSIACLSAGQWRRLARLCGWSRTYTCEVAHRRTMAETGRWWLAPVTSGACAAGAIPHGSPKSYL